MGKIREKEKLEMCLLFGFFSKFYFEGIYVLQPLLRHIRKCFNGGYPRALCVYLSFCWEYFHMQIARFQEKFANFQWIIIINLLQSSFYRLILRICGVLKE